MKRITLILLLLPVPCAVGALEVSLDSVVADTRTGTVEFSLDNKAVFDYDPDTGVLTSSGTWIAQNIIRFNRLIRYSHKFENFSVSIDGGPAVKSYECVEGTFGPGILANICGNYRFGDNLADDGGLVDDIVAGLPKGLYQYELSFLDWDGSNLIVILSLKDWVKQGLYPELSLTLTFSRVADAGGAENNAQ